MKTTANFQLATATISAILQFAAAIVFVSLVSSASCQGPGGPPPGGPPPGGPPPGRPGGRQHTATKSEPLDLVQANQSPPAESVVSIQEKGDSRGIQSNGIPDHKVGRFPNRGNPHEIQEQSYDIEIPADPEPADQITFIHKPGPGRDFRVFGITLDGVMMEPGTAEVWMGRRDSGWNYEALGGAIPLGLDTNYAHVQPGGNYHYHGLPIDLMKRLGYRSGQHSPMIGWAADGFPIYAMYGYTDPDDPTSGVVELKTGYQLKSGERQGGSSGPDGKHDGTFVQDYEFSGNDATLDECNGRFCVTPEFPDGTYAYFMTREWPVIPRAFRGTPTQLKELGPPGGGGPGGRGPEGRRGAPPGGAPPGGQPRHGERPPRRL